MEILVFDVRAPMARFTRPDTTRTQATYPFITRTALRGLIGAILGLDRPEYDDLAAVRLMSAVQTRVQSLSMLDDDFLLGGRKAKTFNRPTSVEWLVRPHYRIYHHGPRTHELAEMIREGRSVYHTYLGVSEAITHPRFVGLYPAEEVDRQSEPADIRCHSVVPTLCVKELIPEPGSTLGRVGGLDRSCEPTSGGGRRFCGAISLIYDRRGAPIVLRPARTGTGNGATPNGETDGGRHDARFIRLGGSDLGETVCLW